VDDYFPVIDAIADRAEDIEQRIFEKFDVSALEDILKLKKELVRLRRLVTPARDVVNVFLRRDPPIMPRQSLPYFQDVYDHIIRVTDSLDTYQELLSSTLDAFLSVQSNRLNEIIYRLTLVSVIFLPLTFLTGFFGMNFEAIHFESGGLLVLALVLMVVTPLTFYRFLARRAWDA
jgi:magnesium transporter